VGLHNLLGNPFFDVNFPSDYKTKEGSVEYCSNVTSISNKYADTS
jgi:hypothetical protein